MDFKQLKTFLAICEANGFSSAALTLCYAQSTVTTQIKLLEEELHVILFNRLGKSISLTQEGERLLPYAKQIIQIERDIFNNISDSAELGGHLVIGTPESLCNLLVPKIIQIFKSKYPKVNIEIKLATSKKLPKLLKDNEIDIAFTIGNKNQMKEFISTSLSNEKMVFLVSPTHILAKQKGITLEQISKFPLLLTSGDCEYRSELVAMANKKGITLDIGMETSNVHALKLFAISSLGITFLPYIAVEDAIINSELVSLDYIENSFDITSEIIYHRDKHIFEAMRIFIEITREVMTLNN